MDKVRDYKDLRIWVQGIEIVKSIYLLTKLFPRDELFGLTNQMRRASISIPSNIAEGFIRSSKIEFNRFLDIALGSCAELETQVLIAKELNYLNEQLSTELREVIISEIKQINNLKKSIIKQLQTTSSGNH